MQHFQAGILGVGGGKPAQHRPFVSPERAIEIVELAIAFFEVFQVAFAIYADCDVRYNLIREHPCDPKQPLDAYRLFSQCQPREDTSEPSHRVRIDV